MDEQFSIGRLKEIDKAWKGPNSDAEWKMLHAYFEDRSREVTMAQLQALEMGISNNEYPLELPALRRLIRRLSTTYKGPASRWLKKNSRRLKADNAQQLLYKKVVKRSRLNAKLRIADRYRTLFGQSVLRFYASDHRKAVVVRNFPPYAVIRQPSGSDPETIDADIQFALKVGKDGDREIWEHWIRQGDRWTQTLVDEKTTPLASEAQPFLTSEGANPYPVLPAYVIYAEDPDGRAWIQPKQSRMSMQIAINAKINDLVALVRGEAHTDQFIKTDRSDDVPDLSGIGVRQVLPADADLLESNKSPKIEESISALRNAAKLWSLTEGLPSADLDESKTILTGAALRVQEGELRELREEQAEFAEDDESAIFEIMRGIWNTHAGTWGEEQLDEALELDVQLAGVDTPTDPDREQTFHHAEIFAGYEHPVQWIQVRDQCDEEEAIRRYQHTQDLFDQYPLPVAPVEPQPTNPIGNPGGDKTPIDSPAAAGASPPPNGAPKPAPRAA